MIRDTNQSCYYFLFKNTMQNREDHAIICDDTSVTFFQLNEYILSFAQYLYENDIRSGDVVTICLPTSMQSIISFYAVNSLGAIANFLHPLLNDDRLRENLLLTKSKMMIAMEDTCRKVLEQKQLDLSAVSCAYAAGTQPNRLMMDQAEDFHEIIARDNHLAQAFLPDHNGAAIACYLHGGGTTGTNKIIKLSNYAINEVIYKASKVVKPEFRKSQTMLSVLPIFHSFGLATAVHLPLCMGWCTVPVMKFDAYQTNELIRKHKVSAIMGVPEIYKKLMLADNFKGSHLKNINWCATGGDFIDEKLLSDFNSIIRKYGARGEIYRGYGLTEVCSVCAVNTYADCRINSVGKPIEGISIQIWNDQKEAVKPNEIGQIVVAGSTLMEGYLETQGDAQIGLYEDSNQTKWVLTGDLGYLDEDGFLYVVGRAKRMIIISGYNVYPYDIEAKVTQLDEVFEACAVQGEHNGKPIIRLFVVLSAQGNSNREKAVQKIRSHCSGQLPYYSCPREIVLLEQMPRTLIGKVNYVVLERQK